VRAAVISATPTGYGTEPGQPGGIQIQAAGFSEAELEALRPKIASRFLQFFGREGYIVDAA
jgi:hypothetical protein